MDHYQTRPIFNVYTKKNPCRLPQCFLIGTMTLLHLFFALNAFGQVEPTQLLSLSQTGGQRGSSFQIRTEIGNNLVEVDQLIFSSPEIQAEVVTGNPAPFSEDRIKQFGTFTVTIPNTLVAGRYEARALGRNGLSNPRSFLVTEQPHQTPASISHQLDAPTDLPLDHFSHADATTAAIDYYQIHLEESSKLHVEIIAQRLDSRMIPSVKILDSSGHQLASTRGADGADASWSSSDPFPAGKYLIAINDFLYRGGADYHYQVVASLDPALSVLGNPEARDGRLPLVWASRSASTLLVDEQGLHRADQPGSDSAETNASGTPTTSSIQLPHRSRHVFSGDASRHDFEFAAEKGQVVAVEVTADRLGHPSDGRVLIQRVEAQQDTSPKLHDVANFDDSQSVSDGAMNLTTKDPSGIFTAPETSKYLISVRDLDIGKTLQDKKNFDVRIGQPQPTFDLIAYRPFPHSDLNQSQPTGSRLHRGGTETIRVIAIRKDGWSGAIQIRCEGLPDGVKASEVRIEANQNFAQVAITADPNAATSVSPIQFIGRSEDGSIERHAVPAVVQWGKGAGRNFIQTRLTDSLWLSVSALDEIQLTAQLGTPDTVEVKKGEAVKIPIKLERKEGGKAAIVARARHFPTGVKAADLTIPAENNEGEFEIKTEASAVPGTYSLWVQVETKIKVKPNPQAVDRAQAYRDLLQKQLDAAGNEDNAESIKAAITEADKAVEAAKNASKEKEITVFLPTNTVNLRVIEP